MQKTIVFFTNFFLFVSIIIFNSCAPPQEVAKRITVESGQIPPDMKTEDFTLIGILQGRKNYDKSVENEFNNYTGKYVLATKEELRTTYKDVEKYRYVMDCIITNDSHYAPANPGSGNGGYTTSTGYRYHILDRKYDKTYTRKGKSGFFGLEMKAYLQAIENIRKK